MFKITQILILLIALFVFSQPIHAQTGGSYDLTWSTIDAGGAESSGGSFELKGTIGQHDVAVISGGGFQLSGGFWQANNTAPTAVTLDAQSGATMASTPLILLGVVSMLLALITFRLSVTKRVQPSPLG